MKYLISLLIIASLAACSSGASGMRRTLGLNRDAPDEFMVVSKPKLQVPPEFNLATPGDVDSLKSSHVSNEARALVFNQKNSKNTNLSRGENLLLAKAGGNADPDIRRKITQDNKDIGLLDIGDPDQVVKVDEEEARLATNKAAGKPVTEGKTPTKRAPGTSPLEQILN